MAIFNTVYGGEYHLPGTYQKVEYIQSSGTQRIDTGVTVNSENRVFQAKFSFTSVWGALFGTKNEEYATHTRFYRSPSIYEWDCYGGNGYGRITYNKSWVSGQIEELELGNNYIKDISSGTTLATGSTSNKSSNHNMPLFCMVDTNDNSYTYASLKLYYFKIIDSGEAVRDFVPCYRKSDSVIGLYDLVGKQFYTNAGSGTFTKGPDA